jgi:hypothetical protein
MDDIIEEYARIIIGGVVLNQQEKQPRQSSSKARRPRGILSKGSRLKPRNPFKPSA